MDEDDRLIGVLGEQRKEILRAGVAEHDRRVAAAAVDVDGPVVALRDLERAAEQPVADRLRVRAALGEAVVAPELEVPIAVVGGRVVDVEAGAVGDHALERDEARDLKRPRRARRRMRPRARGTSRLAGEGRR